MRKFGIVVLLLAFVLVGCSSTADPVIADNQEAKPTKLTIDAYAAEALTFRYDLLDAGATAEGVVNLVKLVWSNTIYERNDVRTDKYTKYNEEYFNSSFNTSLSNLYKSEEYTEPVSKLEEVRPQLARKLRDFRDYPEGGQHLYDALIVMHTKIDDLIELAVDPAGSLQSYSERINEIYADFNRVVDDVFVEVDIILDP